MSSVDIVNKHFEDSIAARIETANTLPPFIAEAAQMIVSSLINGGRVLVCGNGRSAALSQIFSSSLLNTFDMERPPLPAISLSSDISTITSIASDSDFSQIFAKQIAAIGNEADVLLTISSSGNPASIIEAIKEAQSLDIKTIALTGKNDNSIANILQTNDIELQIPSTQSIHIHDNHTIIINSICDLIDRKLFTGLED